MNTRAIRQQVQEKAAQLIKGVKEYPATNAEAQALVGTLAAQLRAEAPEASERQAARAVATALREKFGVVRTRAGTVPVSVALTDEEKAFIAENYAGPTEAIHAALALLMKKHQRK